MKYVIQKTSSSELLFYVDRNKTKSFWWSYNPIYALLFTSKEVAQEKANSLKYGKFEVITEEQMKQRRKSKDFNHGVNTKFNYNEHPFSSEGLGQW